MIKVIDFTEYPGPRYTIHGEDSGEKYYAEILYPAFKTAIENNMEFCIDLDNTAGYAASFIDEIFGNLVYDFDFDIIKEKLKIKSEDEPDWIDVIWEQTIPQWKRKFDEKKNRRPE